MAGSEKALPFLFRAFLGTDNCNKAIEVFSPKASMAIIPEHPQKEITALVEQLTTP